MKTLQSQVEKNSDAFQKLGISQEDVANMSREDLFAATITGLQNVTDENERAALANDLLGRSAIEMGALLNTSAEDTEKMRQTVHDLGGVMSDDAVKAAAAYQDSLQDMNTAIDGVKRGLMSNFLPSVTSVMDGIGKLFSGDSSEGLGAIKDGVSNFIKTLTDSIPKVIETGGKIINALVSAIVENLPSILQAGIQSLLTLVQGISQSLPELIPAIVDAILLMVDTLLDNIDLLVDAALQLMIGLAEGLIKAIPKIIERIPQIISSIVKALVSAAPQIAGAGVQLFVALVKNLPQIIKSIVAAVPKIITGIVNGFKGGIAKMKEVGKNLLTGLGNGLVEGVKGVVEKAKSVAGNVLNAVKGFFGVASPSKEFRKIGGFLMEGMALGIEDNLGMVDDAMSGLDDLVYDAPSSDVATDTMTTTSTIGDNNDLFTVPRQQTPRQLNVVLELDRMVLGRTVYMLNDEETQRVGVKLAGGYA
jgi:phage-related protein